MRFSVNLGNPFICKVNIVRWQEKLADIKSWQTLGEFSAVFEFRVIPGYLDIRA